MFVFLSYYFFFSSIFSWIIILSLWRTCSLFNEAVRSRKSAWAPPAEMCAGNDV